MTSDVQQVSAVVPGWNELVEAIRLLPGQMLEKLPPDCRLDPQIVQEVGRLALETLVSCGIDTLGGDADFPAFLPALGQVLNVGQPNADTIYRATRIDGKGTYRLRGRKGSLNQVKIGQIIAQGALPGNVDLYLDVNRLPVDENGDFDVLISAEKPEGHEGEWWQLHPEANKLMVRMVSNDWLNEEDPTFSIERLDRPMGRGRPSAQSIEANLRALPQFMKGLGLLIVDHVDLMRRDGYLDRFKEFSFHSIGGLTGQFYYEAVFDLTENDALIIETPVPEICPYRSLILTNEIFETIDWTNNHSSLNGAQSPVDADGIWRVVVSMKDPGVKNWLDTAGNQTGIIQGRWTDCDSTPIPSIRKVPLAEVTRHLPEGTAMVTPQERDAIIRERRAAYQQRPLW